MLAIKVINVILWLVVGVIVLKRKEITKFDYALAWITLELILIIRLFT